MMDVIIIKEINIFKIKDEYNYDYLVDDSRHFKNLNSEDGIYDIDELDIRGKIYIGHNNENEPPWYENLKMLSSSVDADIKNQSTRAIAVMEVDKDVYIISFGHGRYMIDEDYMVRNFGRKVVANLIEADSIKTTQTAAIGDFVTSHSSSASRQTNLNDFRINTDSDLLMRIEGNIEILDTKAIAIGSDSIKLNFKEKINADYLIDILRELKVKYNSEAYKQKFGWIDNLLPVKEEKVKIDVFKTALEEYMRGDSNIHLINPEEIEDISTFALTEQGESVEDINDLEDSIKIRWLGDITEQRLSNILAKRIYVHDKLNDDSFSWNFKKCLTGEVTVSGKVFTLFLGNIYQLDEDFVRSINAKISDYQNNYNYHLDFEICELDENEYLKNETKNRKDMICLDRDNIVYDGVQIEACDILTDEKELIHVKKWSSSSTLSHLFQQGIVSAELLLNERNFRTQLNNKLDDVRFKVSEDTFQSSDYTIIYSVLFKDEEYNFINLPIFSKIVMVDSFQQLTNLSYSVKFNKLIYIPKKKEENEA